MTFEEAMNSYGNDKPDLRFDMKIHELTGILKGKGFSIFDQADYIGGICAEGCSEYTRKQLDELTEWVKTSADWSKRFNIYKVWSRWDLQIIHR